MNLARLLLSRNLAWRSVMYRPWRSLLLCAGFGLGVGVMIVLLAVGEAMVAQASQERLVGGGEVTVLPDGIDIDVLTTGGLGGLFFSIPNARFIYRHVLTSPRLARVVGVVAPQIEGKLLYLTTPDGTQHPVRATGEIPSATFALGARPELLGGAWDDDDGDRRWSQPTVSELRHDIDHFHLPPTSLGRPDSWGEWHYFNVLSADATRWAFISFMVAGDVRGTQWGGQLLVTLHAPGKAPRRFSATVPRNRVRFSLRDADLVVGDGAVSVQPDGSYAVRARIDDAGGALALDLRVTPAPRVDFPGATLASGDFVSGYAVPALRASATGSICVNRVCDRYEMAQAYHDHNWGGWGGVSWEWGATRAGPFTLLYGRVAPEDSTAGDAPLFVYLADSTGFVALFRPTTIRYDDRRVVQTSAGALKVPATAELLDVRGGDTLRLRLRIDDAVATDTRRPAEERGSSAAARGLGRPWFVQMAGEVELSGRVHGQTLSGRGRGFFETFR